MMLDDRTYHLFCSKLRSYEDIDIMAKKYRGKSREFFLVIFTQKKIREVTARFHDVKRSSKKLSREWEGGKSFIDISKKIDFPPVMTAFMILTYKGVGRKTFRKMVHEPDKVDDPRVREELREVKEEDHLYSPEGDRIQRQRGVWGEERLREWLDGIGVRYKREEELRADGSKTPDFLLENPIYFRGEEINWIESKASFGDLRDVRKNLNKQLYPYRDLFGPGMVIYWFGIIDSLPTIPGIVIETEEVLDDIWDYE